MRLKDGGIYIIGTNGDFEKYNVYDAQSSVIVGKIVGKPRTLSNIDIPLYYVKLSINQSKLYSEKYGKSVEKYYNDANSSFISKIGIGASFPHDSTIDQHFSKDQFRAYRDLGHNIGLDLVDLLDKR